MWFVVRPFRHGRGPRLPGLSVVQACTPEHQNKTMTRLKFLAMVALLLGLMALGEPESGRDSAAYVVSGGAEDGPSDGVSAAPIPLR